MADKRKVVSWVFIVAVALVLVLGVGFMLGNGADIINSWFRAHDAKTATVDPAHEESERIRRETMLIVGVSNEEEPVGFSYVRLDENEHRIYEMDVRPDIVLPLPDGTARILGDIYKENSTLAMSYLSNYLGIPSAHWVLTPRANYAAAMQSQDPAAFLSQITKTNFATKKEFLAYSAKLDEITKSETESDMLVSVPLECGSNIFNEPHREQNAEFISMRWGVDPEYLSAATQVAVLNGTETRGLGSAVAEKLLFNGLQIAEIGNANTFDYENTHLNSIGDSTGSGDEDGNEKSLYQADVDKIEKLLGVSASAVENTTLDADAEYNIAVCIGRDCTVKVPE